MSVIHLGKRIKKQISITLSGPALFRLERMAESRGLDRSNMVEFLIYGPVKASPKPRKDHSDLSEKLDKALADIEETQKKYSRVS